MVTSKIGPMIYVRISKNDWPVSGTCASSTMLVGTILSTIVYDRCTMKSLDLLDTDHNIEKKMVWHTAD